MALNQDQKDDVYMTVSIELVRMFDILLSTYDKPSHTEQLQLITEIEKDLRENWEIFKLPT
ncbi:MAG: hypothetical protein IPI64_11355 [Chloracidobacterium sp.]|nr:hypothetical protein [Chloracidobacterium sp.]